ncbi:MAG TPA: sugar ABC transporter permease [Solirubrobacteraceae bacterium]|nr:sugar ABC transporter permease [Solirubrobacteraceae bacterium]
MSAVDVAPATAPRARRALRWRPGERTGYAMASPAVIALAAITAYPLLWNLWTSFHDVDPLTGGTGQFVGLSNYRAVFSSQTGLLAALMHTLIYMVVSVTVEMALGLGIALLLNRPMRGRALCRTLILLPWAVPTVVSALVWQTLFDPQGGGVNYMLSMLHLPGSHTVWIGATASATWASILVADAWQSTPFVALMLLAGLQAIPRELYEAARVDGASAWQTFRGVTLPNLRPALMVTLVFRTLQAFLIFDIIYALTQGGPGTSTQTISYMTYYNFIVSDNFGVGAAISIVMVIVCLLIAGVYRVLLRPST